MLRTPQEGDLRLDRITLKNFRCFETCTLELHPELTVLVAENGQGKTALLEAISIALAPLLDTIAASKPMLYFDETDIRRQATGHQAEDVSLDACGSVACDSVTWARHRPLNTRWARRFDRGAKPLHSVGNGLRERLLTDAARIDDSPHIALPMVAFYGTGRLWSSKRVTEKKRARESTAADRVLAYTDSLDSSSSFRAFANWYRDMTAAAANPNSVAIPAHLQPMKLLSAVRAAVATVLEPTGWHSIDYRPTRGLGGEGMWRGELVVEHPGMGTLPLSQLSDGVRNMVALASDLAHRCVRLNPHFGEDAPKHTPGVLLIDEVDMHLHPGWQQLVIILLQRAFPKMQLVVSTHSPQVLSAVDHRSMRVIRVENGIGHIETPLVQTRGVASADVLARIMGVDPVPQIEEAAWINEYRGLLQLGREGDQRAKDLRSKLIVHFGGAHPIMQDIAVEEEFQRFRRARATPSEAS